MRREVKKPNGVLYLIVYLLIYPVLKLVFRLKVDRGAYRPPRGSFIAVSNHQSFMDFLLVMLTIYPRRLNAVTALKFFLYRPLDKLLPMMGCIPKKLFDPDTRSIKGIMAVLNRGDAVLLFPEGRCSVDGAYMGIHKSTGKLIKRLGAPVISCRIEGSYICMPFWRKGIRPGRVRVTLSNLFDAEKINALPEEELTRRLDERLGGDLEPAGSLGVYRARRLAQGLENILYYCPECEREFTLYTRGNAIACKACGFEGTMDRAARLHCARGDITSVHDWYKLQCVYERQFLHEAMAPVKTRAIVRMPLRAGKGVDPCGEGELWLDPRGWHYAGELLGEDVRLFFPIATVPALPFDPNDDFQIYAQGNFYMFTPVNKRASAKYATIGECAPWRFAEDAQMTCAQDGGFCAE